MIYIVRTTHTNLFFLAHSTDHAREQAQKNGPWTINNIQPFCHAPAEPYHPHHLPESVKRHCRRLTPSEAMDLLDVLTAGYGVELCAPENGGWTDGFMYVNHGDAYSPTIVWDWTTHRFHWHSTWGDILEMHERKGVKYA